MITVAACLKCNGMDRIFKSSVVTIYDADDAVMGLQVPLLTEMNRSTVIQNWHVTLLGASTHVNEGAFAQICQCV